MDCAQCAVPSGNQIIIHHIAFHFQTEHVAVYWAGATVGTLAAQLLYPTVRKMVYRPQEDRTKKSA